MWAVHYLYIFLFSDMHLSSRDVLHYTSGGQETSKRSESKFFTVDTYLSYEKACDRFVLWFLCRFCMIFSEVPNFSEPNPEVLAKINQINNTHVSREAQREKRWIKHKVWVYVNVIVDSRWSQKLRAAHLIFRIQEHLLDLQVFYMKLEHCESIFKLFDEFISQFIFSFSQQTAPLCFCHLLLHKRALLVVVGDVWTVHIGMAVPRCQVAINPPSLMDGTLDGRWKDESAAWKYLSIQVFFSSCFVLFKNLLLVFW